MTVVDLLSEARTLSSGTISKLCRDSAILFDYQCGEYRWLDAVQLAFCRFCESDKCGDVESWQDAWEAYAKWYLHVRDNCWQSSYQGEVDYIIDCKRYSVRWAAPVHAAWNGDYFETGIKMMIGTVRRNCGMADGFPPPEVCCCFPGIVPVTARFDWIDGEVRNWEYVYHPDYSGRTYHEKHNGETLESDWVTDYDRVDWEADSCASAIRTRRRWK